jgi:hypothetical protein
MRKVLFAAAALAVSFAIATVAQGNVVTSPGGQSQSLEVTHSPAKSGKGTFVNVVLAVRCDPAKQCQAPPAPVGKASPVTNTLVHLPKGMKLGYKDFPTCNPSNLEKSGLKGCSKKAIVGKGKLTADGRPVVEAPVQGTVTAFNGTNRRYLLYVIPELSSPLVLVGKLTGTTLSIPVPLVPTLPGQPEATLTDFQIKTGGKVRKKKRGKRVTINYLQNPKKCPSGGFKWTFDFKYQNGESLSPTDTVSC